MSSKEIKVLLDEASSEMSFYRMEGGRWCLIDDSDDDLRPYIQENASSDVWDDAFFRALRQAAFAQSGERLVIWFEGSSDDYSDFRECLDDCDLDEDIRVKRVKQEKPQPVEETVPKEKAEPAEVTPEAKAAQSAAEKVPDEEIDEVTGLLKGPDDNYKWSWDKNIPSLPEKEKEEIVLDEKTVVTKDTVLINKAIRLEGEVVLEATVELIHCVVSVGEKGHIDVRENSDLWLKSCIVKSAEEDNRWNGRSKEDTLVYAEGDLYIYGCTIRDLIIAPRKAWAVYSRNMLRLAHTAFFDCEGSFIYSGQDLSAELILTKNFKGQFLKADCNRKTRDSSGRVSCVVGEGVKNYLNACHFEFSPRKAWVDRLTVNGHDLGNAYTTDPFLEIDSAYVFSCRFIQTGSAGAWGNDTCISVKNSDFDTCKFKRCAKIEADTDYEKNTSFEDTQFFRCSKIEAHGNVEWKGCTFKECVQLGGSDEALIDYYEIVPECTTNFENCTMERCVTGRLLSFTYGKELEQYLTCSIEGNTFKECVAAETLIYGSIDEKMSSETNSVVEDNTFISCDAPKYVVSEGVYGLFKKPCCPFRIGANETEAELTEWTEQIVETLGQFDLEEEYLDATQAVCREIERLHEADNDEN